MSPGAHFYARQVLGGLAMAKKKAKQEEPEIDGKRGLSTGSTLVNLALSKDPFWGYLPGHYYSWVGPSAAGKTAFQLTTLAEAAHSKQYADYRLIYDDIEEGALFDIERLFGAKTAERLEAPLDKEGEARPSRTIEDFYYNVDDALVVAKKEGRPFIYVCDSMDGLYSEDEEKKFRKDKKRSRKSGGEAGGSYGDGKAKKNSQNLRRVVRKLQETGSILIIVSQERDVLNAMPFQQKKTKAGGRALKFYATAELWTANAGPVKKKVNDKNRKVGDNVKVTVTKNRIQGMNPDVEVAIYPSYGIDDVGSCVDFMLAEGFWSKSKKRIDAGEFGSGLSRRELVGVIEDGRTKEFKRRVGAAWLEIDKACALDRKPRYGS